jgi:hypothetical protein
MSRPISLPTLTAFLTATLLSSFTVRATAADVEKGFTPIFNGKDLTGWEGNLTNWSVEDGAITGETGPAKPAAHCNYLFWRGGKPANFELRCSFRVSAGGNSGVQFRSRELPEFDVAGYQADIEGGPNYMGDLYDCNGRHTITHRGQKVVIDENGQREVTPIGDPDALQKLIKLDNWNDYRIIARGHEITLIINGAVMSRTIDREKGKATLDGLIALQLHNGLPMKVQFKNIRIKNLP